MNIKHLKFRTRLIFSFAMIAIPLILLSNGFIYFEVKKILESGIEKELQQGADSLANLVQTSADIMIESHLQAIAEKNLQLTEYYYSKYQSGLLTRQQAMDTIEEIFLNQSIGKSGYISCLDTSGNAIIHPNPKIKGTHISNVDFLKKQLARENGYLEYEVKDPETGEARSKALFMVYFKPLGWIISASSYREEFHDLIDIKKFTPAIRSFVSGNSGYAFIVDESGNALIHPDLQGVNLLQNTRSAPVIQAVLSQKNGNLRYLWQPPTESSLKEKIVFFRHIPEYKWIIGTTSYIEEVFSPLAAFSLLLLMNILFIVVAFIGASFLVSKSIMRPLTELNRILSDGAGGDHNTRMPSWADDELGGLAQHFNAFMDRLKKSHTQLNQEIQKTIDTQTALVENELKLRGLFNQSFHLTCILSPFGIVEEVNKSFLEFAGCTEADVLYRPYWETPWWQSDDPDLKEKIRDALQRAKEGELVRMESNHVTHSGEIRTIDISIKPIINNESKVEFLVTEGRDITKLKQGEAERRQLAIQLEKSQKMEAIGTLAGGIAHDFNNILSSIFGYAQLAEISLDSPEETKKHLGQIVKGAHRASALIQQILTFSRQTEYKKHPLKFHLVVKEALKLLRSSIPTTIEINTQINSRDMINADPTQMHQLIMNLCTNAFHSMQETGGTMTVCLDTVDRVNDGHCGNERQISGPLLRLMVRDTGHGMDEKTMEKAFDPYFTTKEVGQGTGIGLALVQAIVGEHEGCIHVESEPGNGASFYIYIPTAKDKTMPLPKAAPPKTSPVGGNETIMVVDDEPDIRGLMMALLEKFGYAVEVFENGKDALTAFMENPKKFDLVITDMTMPQMTGTVLAQEIFKENPNIPVILCSGYNDTLTQEKTTKIGIRHFLQKPLKNDDFLSIVRTVLDS